MPRQENIETHGRIYGNGLKTPDSPGVTDDSVFDSEKQIYVPKEEFDTKSPEKYHPIGGIRQLIPKREGLRAASN